VRELARVGALAAAVLVILRDLAIAGHSGALSAATGILALLLAGSLALRRDGFVTGTAVALGAHYLAALVYGDVEIDLAAPFMAGLVLVFLELGDLAVALPADRRVDTALVRRTARQCGLILVVASAAGAAAFVLAAVPWPAGEWLRAVGALGIVGAVAGPLILLRRAQ
jgi:hypothetical protein